jgi:aldehyde:ferredoxin oxidoreductase
MPNGYMGKILRVDLTSETITVEEPSSDFYRKHLGGSALNLYYLLQEMPAKVDALAPENILALSVGVTTGVPISGQSRMTATAKSPLTGAIGDSQCGGFWPAKLKFAGFDGIIIKGKAAKPVYLWIDDGQAELRDASHLWGKITGETEAAIRDELGDAKIEVLQIGPGGEKMVRFASLINMCSRANGRTGMGAVMGSKNLKAVAVRGSQKPQVDDKEALGELTKWGAKTFPNADVAGLGKLGTAGVVSVQQALGGLPTYNFNSGVFDGWEAIDGETLYNTLLAGSQDGQQDRKGRDTCYGCIIRCKRVVDFSQGSYYAEPLYGGPEYESIAGLGSYCGIDDLAAICNANELCNKYGIDTITGGATIAWAMEAFEAGVLTTADTGGLELKFGDAQSMIKLVQMMADREGFGDILAEGSAGAAAKLGKGAEFLITAKGQEAPAHMPQVKRSLALMYAVNPFGSDHESSDHDLTYEEDSYKAFEDRYASLGLNNPLPALSLEPAKVEFARITQQFFGMLDSLNLCHFVWGVSWPLYGPEQAVAMVKAVTGWDVTLQELLEVGERRVNMMRAFNAREGIARDQDKLATKFFDRPLKGGPSDGLKVDRAHFEAALQEYYRRCGWDESSGIPKRETLERLGLDWVADQLAI